MMRFSRLRGPSPDQLSACFPARAQEVERNLATLIETARRVHEQHAHARFLVACFRESHRRFINGHLRQSSLPIEVLVGRTPEIIELSLACVAVSGSVGLELLYRCKPSVVLYRVGSLGLRVARWLKTSRYISLVNLLAEKELFPEYLTDRCEAEAISRHLTRWLDNEDAYHKRCAQLATLRARVARPGACDRAAQFVLAILSGNEPASQEAA